MAKQVHQDAISELSGLFREYMIKSHHPSSKTERHQQQLIKLIAANSTLITENISFFYSNLEFLSDRHPEIAKLINTILPDKSLSAKIDNLATKLTNGDEASVNELTHLLSANVQEVFTNLYAFKSLWKLTEGKQNTQAIFAEFANAHNEAIVSSQYIEPTLRDILSDNYSFAIALEHQLPTNKLHYNKYIYNFLEKNLQQIINLNPNSSYLLAHILYKASTDKETNNIVDNFFESNTSLFFSNNLLLKHLIKNALENSDSGQKAKERLFTNLINYKKEILSLPEVLSSFMKIIDQAPELHPAYINFLKKPLSLDEAREVFLESDNAEYLMGEFTSLLFVSLPPGPERGAFISAALNKHAKIILTNQYATIGLFKATPLPILINFLENNISLVAKQHQPLSIIMGLISIMPDIALPKELIANIFNQETLATLKIKSKTPVELLKKWGIQTNQSINKIVIDDEIVTNPIIKSILSKITAHFEMSEQENIALQHNLSQCLEIAMQHNDIKAALTLSTYYTKTIDVYKGLSANSIGDYSPMALT